MEGGVGLVISVISASSTERSSVSCMGVGLGMRMGVGMGVNITARAFADVFDWEEVRFNVEEDARFVGKIGNREFFGGRVTAEEGGELGVV